MNKKKKWKKNKPVVLDAYASGYGLRSGEMLRGLKEFNKPSFIEKNSDLVSAFGYTEYLTHLRKITNKAYKFEKHVGYGRDYPGTPMLDKSFKLSDGEKDALSTFKKKKPFKADKPDYLDMIQELFIDLAKVQGHRPPGVMHTGVWETRKKVTSFYTPHVVILTGPRSVITALHEYTHSQGFGEVVAVWWSTNAFRLTFPKSFSKLEQHPYHPHLMSRKRPNKDVEKVNLDECPF